MGAFFYPAELLNALRDVIEKQIYRSRQFLTVRKKYNRTKSFFDKAELYTKGIVQSELRNIARISEDLDVCYHRMQHFTSESKWNARGVIDQVALEVSQSLPKRKLTGFIDESGWVKKEDKSVGVGWQYCGNVGKLSADAIDDMGSVYLLDIH